MANVVFTDGIVELIKGVGVAKVELKPLVISTQLLEPLKISLTELVIFAQIEVGTVSFANDAVLAV